MLDKFEEYLSILPLTKVIKERVEEVINLNQKIINIDILDIFISDMKNSEGAKEYTSLWLFADSIAIECKNFLSKDDFDISPYKNRIDYCSIVPVDFDFDVVTEKSSVRIHCVMGSATFDLIATEGNCMEAFKIYQKYLIANLLT